MLWFIGCLILGVALLFAIGCLIAGSVYLVLGAFFSVGQVIGRLIRGRKQPVPEVEATEEEPPVTPAPRVEREVPLNLTPFSQAKFMTGKVEVVLQGKITFKRTDVKKWGNFVVFHLTNEGITIKGEIDEDAYLIYPFELGDEVTLVGKMDAGIVKASSVLFLKQDAAEVPESLPVADSLEGAEGIGDMSVQPDAS